ncbi:hypothetical protein EBU94_02415 [bacterium]|nr:hypothetical protein [bacterium]
MKKLAGTDVIVLMKAAIKSNDVLKEAQTLTRADFDSDDLIVNCFYRVMPDGFATQNLHTKLASSDIIKSLESIKKEITTQGLRKAFNYIQNLRDASDSAVRMENQINEFRESSKRLTLNKAANLLTFLSKYADGAKNREILAAAAEELKSGKFENASEQIRTTFAQTNSLNTTKNFKKAFVTVRQQIGEGYQMCPKGIYQSGRPIPMALSSCREYCIDARLNPDGTVGCNYVKWLNDNLLTQEQALNVPDFVKVDQVTVNLKPGERTKFPLSDQDPQDSQMIRDEKLTEKITTVPWEEQLKATHKNTEKREDPKFAPVASDSAIELLLKDVRDVFDDDELDTLEAQLMELMGE